MRHKKELLTVKGFSLNFHGTAQSKRKKKTQLQTGLQFDSSFICKVYNKKTHSSIDIKLD